MRSLELHFVTTPQPCLIRTIFCSDDGAETLECVLGGSRRFGKFSWSKGVRALSILLLDYFRAKAEDAPLPLAGGAGTLAASLDNALSKQPAWLLDMFGVDEHGACVAREIIDRHNPERKRPGPVTLSINSDVLSQAALRVFVDELPIVKPEFAFALREAIESGTKGEFPAVVLDTEGPGPLTEQAFKKFLKETTAVELDSCLKSVDVFSERKYRRHLQALQADECFKYYMGKGKQFDLESVVQPRSAAERLGLVPQEQIKGIIDDCGPLKFRITLGEVGALAILWHMKFCLGYNIEIAFHSPHALQIVQEVMRKDDDTAPDFCTLAIASTISALKNQSNHDYAPMMLMPSGSFRFLGMPNEEKTPKGRLAILRADPSSSEYYLKELNMKGVVKTSETEFEHAEPDELFHLQTEDNVTHAVNWFPHYRVNQVIHGAELDSAAKATSQKEIFLFAKKQVLARPDLADAVELAIRDSWLTLLTNKELRTKVHTEFAEDDIYQKTFLRLTGLYNRLV